MIRRTTRTTHPNGFTAIAGVFALCLLISAQALFAQSTVPPKEYAGGNVQALTKSLAANPSLAKNKFTDDMTLLHFAAMDGNIPAAQLLIKKGADVVATDKVNSQTPLLLANGLDMVKLLVESGADVKAYDSSGYTRLHSAGLEEAKYLLEHGADIEAATVSGRTPLIMAAQGYDKALVELLLSKGADINATCELGTALGAAALWGNSAEIVRLLIVKGTDLSIKDQNDATPLEVARARKDADTPNVKMMLQLLEKAGAGEDVSGMQVKDSFALSQLLDRVKYSAATDAAAILKANPELANAADASGAMALHFAAAAEGDGPSTDAAVIKALLDAGANVNATKLDGVTALHIAASLGKMEAAKALLAGGAKPNVADKKGRTPLSLAKEKKNQAMVDLLSKPPAKAVKPDSSVHQPPGTKAILSTETSLAGIAPGDTRADVERLYGTGSFQNGKESDILSYGDPGGEATMWVKLGKSDGAVSGIQISKERGDFRTKAKKPFADVATKAGIRLGSTRSDVGQAYGVEPGESEPAWQYGFDMSGRWFILGFGTVDNVVTLIKLDGGRLK